MKALIVDDENDIGMMLTKLLSKLGIDSQYADRCSKAKELLKNSEFDYCFLDVHLPDGSGLDLIPEIVKLKNDPEIIVVSAYDDVETKLDFQKIRGFIKKPFSYNEIETIIAA